MKLRVEQWRTGSFVLFWIVLPIATAAAGLLTFYGTGFLLYTVTGRHLGLTLEIDLAVAALVSVGMIAWGLVVSRRWLGSRSRMKARNGSGA